MLNPEFGVGDIAKELGKKWSDADPETKSKYEAMAEKDKARYEKVYFLFFSYIDVQQHKNHFQMLITLNRIK